MGGEGSGRKENPTNRVVNNLVAFNNVPPVQDGNVYLPNFMGLKEGVKKTDSFSSSGVSGGVLFGDLNQDASNFYWDDTSKRLGIGTTGPERKLEIAQDLTTATTGQLALIGSSDPNKELFLGYDTTNDLGFIQAIHQTVDTTNLALQPNGGNVGIGTTSPADKLSVNGDVNISGGRLKITPSANSQIDFYNTATSRGAVGVDGGGTIAVGASAGDFVVRSETGSILFAFAGGNEKVRINATTGYVGIGTTTPTNQLTLSGGAVIEMTNASDTTPTIVLSGGVFVSGGGLWYKGYAGTYTQLASS